MTEYVARRVPARVVAIGFLLLLVHDVDETFFHPASGGVVNLVGTAVVGVLVVFLYRRLGRWWRAGMTGALGLLGTLQGFSGHVWHVVTGGAAPLDYSGILYTLGGVILLSIGIAEARGPHAPPLVS